MSKFKPGDKVLVVGKDSVSTCTERGKVKIIRNLARNSNRDLEYVTTTDDHAFWVYELEKFTDGWDE